MESLGRHTDYGHEGLSELDVAADPFEQFATWLHAAEAAEIFEPNAFVLGTIDSDGSTSSRTVLLKGIDQESQPGSFHFVTNYGSRKARAIMANPSVSMLFPWYALKRQVIVYGEATKATAEVSDALWNRRPHGAKLASMASEQSSPVVSRELLDARLVELEAQFPVGTDVARPANWGAFAVTPSAIEFWQGRSMRFHDRLRYEFVDGGWRIIRLQP